VFRDADAVSYIQGLPAGNEGGAGVAFFFGVMPIGMIAGKFKIQLALAEFDLLQAQRVGVGGVKKRLKAAVFDAGAQSVYVP